MERVYARPSRLHKGRRIDLTPHVAAASRLRCNAIDPTQIQALRKIATMRSIPYQTLIRQWLAETIRRELRIGSA